MRSRAVEAVAGVVFGVLSLALVIAAQTGDLTAVLIIGILAGIDGLIGFTFSVLGVVERRRRALYDFQDREEATRQVGAIEHNLATHRDDRDAQTKDSLDLVKNGTPQDVQAAIDKGADLEAMDKDGWTPLRWAAAYNQNPEVINKLAMAGARIEAHDVGGMTALMFAAWINPNPEVVTTLLRAGADVKAKSSSGRTALDYARDNEKLQGTDALKQLEEASK